MRDRGITSSASRSDPAFLNVTVPANDRYQPWSAHAFAMSALPEKQWNTVRSGAPTRSRVSKTSAWASRSWICRARPRCFAISMCASNERS